MDDLKWKALALMGPSAKSAGLREHRSRTVRQKFIPNRIMHAEPVGRSIFMSLMGYGTGSLSHPSVNSALSSLR